MNFKWINDIIYWLISSGALTTAFLFAWKYLKPVLEAKKQHAKTVQAKESLELVERLAQTAVDSMVSNESLSGHDKFKAATGLVNHSLADKGFDVNTQVVNHAVQAAYEKSPLTPTTIPETKSDNLGQKVPDLVPGTAEAIDPTKGEN